jgi:regulator of sigma E protease
VQNQDGQQRQIQVQPSFISPFGATPLHFAGMIPRPRIETLVEHSVAKGRILPGDVVVRLVNRSTNDAVENLTSQRLMSSLNDAGRNDVRIDLVVLRDGQEVVVEDLSPNARLGEGRRGLGVSLSYEEERAIVANVVAASPAARAGVAAGAAIVAVAGEPVVSWYDVHRVLAQTSIDQPILVTARTSAGEREYQLNLTPADQQQIQSNRYAATLALRERIEPRSTKNPFVAAAWGVGETRDLIIQFYLTLRRMVTGDISYKSMMGPVGIFSAGTKFAHRGNDWLIWFLAMISANLAVVNFLPIPIVDGGLFVFLIVEKLQGKPISPRMQSIAQVVGLALILSIFLLVTYQDILRIGNF